MVGMSLRGVVQAWSYSGLRRGLAYGQGFAGSAGCSLSSSPVLLGSIFIYDLLIALAKRWTGQDANAV